MDGYRAVSEHGVVLVLPIGTKRSTEEQEISDEGMTIGFSVQCLLVLWGQGAFAREEERAVFFGEVVGEFRASAMVKRRGGGQRLKRDGKEECAFGLPFDVDKPAPGECL
jgi:hypothetical protein